MIRKLIQRVFRRRDGARAGATPGDRPAPQAQPAPLPREPTRYSGSAEGMNRDGILEKRGNRNNRQYKMIEPPMAAPQSYQRQNAYEKRRAEGR